MKTPIRLTRAQIAALAAQADRAYHVALRATGMSALAEEAVQEAFTKLLKKPPEDRGETERMHYFLRLVRGTAIDLTRSAQRRSRREETLVLNASTKSEDELAEREAARAARKALAALPQGEREAVGLCCELDMTHREASRILGVPERTISDRVQRGLAKLRTSLVAQGFAGMATPAVAESLRNLGAVGAPEALAGSLREATNAVLAESMTLAPTAAGKSVGVYVVATVLTVAAVGGGAAYSQFSGTQSAQVKTEAFSNVGSAIPAPKETAERKATLERIWTFARGLPADLKVLSGKATVEDFGGAPHLVPKSSLMLLLPMEMPEGPFVVEMLGRRMDNTTGLSFGAMRTDGQEPQGVRYWNAGKHPTGGNRGVLARWYVNGRWAMQETDGKVGALHLYPEAYPKRLFVILNGYAVRELAVREIKQENLPPRFRDPKALLQSLEEDSRN